MSGFDSPEVQENLHRHDTIDRAQIDPKTKTPSVVEVPILKPENFGENMAIDDKGLSDEGYTVLSNQDTGMIAAMIKSTKASIICEVLQKIPVKIRYEVRSITKDLAQNYDWVARAMFLNAMKVGDKFHVLCLAFEALQSIRVRYRQRALEKERLRSEAHNVRQAQLRDEAKRQGGKHKTEPLSPAYQYSNQETECQLLARSRYLLFKFEEDWTASQKERAHILFKHFPEIKKAYHLILAFRGFYNRSPGLSSSRCDAEKSLKKWQRKVGACNISEIQNFASTVSRHQADILNYFIHGKTNASAESLNSKLQRFIHNNYGVHNRDFFHFRVSRFLS